MEKLLTYIRRTDALTAIFIITALLVGGFFAISVPLGYSDDEYAHVPKAYSVSRGHFFAQQIGTVSFDGKDVPYYGGHVPFSISDLENLAVTEGVAKHRCQYVRYAAVCGKLSSETQQEIGKAANAKLEPNNARVMDFGGASSYLFAPYIPSAVGINVGNVLGLPVGDVLKLGRIFSLLTYLAIVGLGLFLIRSSRVRWLIFSIALLPQSLVMAASIGVDMALNALSLLLICLAVIAIKQRQSLPRFLTLGLVVVAAALPLLKLPYIILSLIVLFLPIYPRSRTYLWRAITAVVILIPAFVYTSLTSEMGQAQSIIMHAGSTTPDMAQQLSFILKHPIDYIGIFANSLFEKEWLSSITVITHQRVPLPDVVLLLNSILVAVAAVAAGASIAYRRAAFGALFVLLGIITPVAIATALYGGYTPVANPYIEGVQGRYFIPCLAFITLGAGLLVHSDIKPTRVGRYGFVATTILCLIVSCVYYTKAVYI